MRLLFCGAPASGKSSLAREVARRTRYPLIDTDHEIERLYREEYMAERSIGEIFELLGEASFRQWEADVLRALPPSKELVVSLGGGITQLPEIEGPKRVIYCHCPQELLWQRLMQRPALPRYLAGIEDPQQLFFRRVALRCALYEQMAEIALSTEKGSPEELAEQLCSTLGLC